MSDLDVALRLRLDYEGRDAARLERDLKDVQKAADRLARSRARGLQDDLSKVSGEAKQAAAALRDPAEKIKALDRLKTDRVAGELASLRTAAQQVSGKIKVTSSDFKAFNRLKTDRIEGEVDSLRGALEQVGTKLDGTSSGFKALNKLKLNEAEAELKSLGKAADGVGDRLDRARRARGVGGDEYTNNGPRRKVKAGPSSAARAAEAAYDRSPIGALVPIAGGAPVVAGAAVAGGAIVAGRSYEHYAEAERRMTYLGFNAGATQSETEAATRQVRAMALQLGIKFDEAVAALEEIVAAGQTMPKALSLLPSALKSTIASGAPSADMAKTIESATVAMKIDPSQTMAIADTVIGAGDLGKFEIADMARYLPSLLPQAGFNLGYTGIEGLQKVAADLQIVRAQSGTSEEAYTRLKDFYTKIFSTSTQDAFKDEGLDLRGAVNHAVKTGGDPVEAAVGVVRKAIAKDPTILPRIFTEQDSRQAGQALATAGDQRSVLMGQMSAAGGSTEKRFQIVTEDATSAIGRLGNAASNAAYAFGAFLDRMGVTDTLNTTAGVLDLYAQKGPVGATTDAWSNTYRRLWTDPAMSVLDWAFGPDTPSGPARGVPPSDGPAPPISGIDPPKPAFPMPRAKPTAAALQGSIGPAGREAMNAYNAELDAGGKESVSIARRIANELASIFSFSAGPTITPSYSGNAGPSPISAPAGRPPIQGPTTIHNRIDGSGSPMKTARATVREQNRAIRSARAGALHDTGRLA
ncbi:phage tail tape measure protein [Amorphus sp. MBR-141]